MYFIKTAKESANLNEFSLDLIQQIFIELEQVPSFHQGDNSECFKKYLKGQRIIHSLFTTYILPINKSLF